MWGLFSVRVAIRPLEVVLKRVRGSSAVVVEGVFAAEENVEDWKEE